MHVNTKLLMTFLNHRKKYYANRCHPWSIEYDTVICNRKQWRKLNKEVVYYERRKHLPTLPKSFEDAINFVSN